MSADDVSLQAQVEAVLGTLVQAAAVELIKLFRASVRHGSGGKGGLEAPHGRPAAGRSVGVQVGQQDALGLDEEDPREEKQQGAVGLEQQVGVVLEPRLCEADCPADGKSRKEAVLEDMWDETLQRGSAQSFLTKNKRLVVRLGRRDSISPEKLKFVRPLVLKPEPPPPPKPDVLSPVKAEPQQACVSTTGGSAYSPLPSDGSLTPAEVGVWQRVHTPKEKNDLHMKLKLTSPDRTPMRPCTVPLVDMLTVPESERSSEDADASDQSSKSHGGLGQLKDLRHHPGLHTGHRVCCFRPCGDGTWRLKKVVTHTQEGYVCSICRKAFTRRKILRRHQRFHTGEKPYSCPECSKTFALRKSLRRHTRFHTGERPHVCTKCSKSFRLRENLKAHLRFHTGEKPFSCTACGKMFRIMRNLEKHKCHTDFVPSFRVIAGL